MEHELAAVEHPAQRAAVEHVCLNCLDLDALERPQPRPIANRHPDVVTGGDELRRQVCADESGRAGNADLHLPSR